MLAAGIGPIGPVEGIIILLVVVLIFGVGKLSDLGGALGKSVREFRRAASTDDDDDALGSKSAELNESNNATQTSEPSLFCTKCGAKMETTTRFCSECGTPAQAAVNR